MYMSSIRSLNLSLKGSENTGPEVCVLSVSFDLSSNLALPSDSQNARRMYVAFTACLARKLTVVRLLHQCTDVGLLILLFYRR